MIAFDEGQEDVPEGEQEEAPQDITVAFTPAQLAVGTNLMALGLAPMADELLKVESAEAQASF